MLCKPAESQTRGCQDPEGTANTHAKVEWKARNAAQNLVRKWITLLLPLCLGRTL